MKNILFVASFLALILFGCEYPQKVTLDNGKPQLAVDGWIYNTPGPYEIKLTFTNNYFDNSSPKVISDAKVVIEDKDTLGNIIADTLVFNNSKQAFVTTKLNGTISHTYTLKISALGEEFVSSSKLNRVPPVDSLYSEFEKAGLGNDEGYAVTFVARDFPGRGDYYRFKVYRKKPADIEPILYNKPENLTVADDQNTDGFDFIPPIQFSFNPEPYSPGDVVTAEIISIDRNAYLFFDEAIEQINNGGLFASPPANVRTNIYNVNPNSSVEAVGLFGAGGVSRRDVLIQK